jgi:hypothetical protein
MLQMHPEHKASDLGFRLDSYNVDGVQVWRWRRGSDGSWPEFLSEDAAMVWMDHALRTASLFNR